MRLFIAIDLDATIRQRILRFMDGVREFAPGVRWLSPAFLHITLKFIGQTEQFEAIQEKLGQIQAVRSQISFRGTGFFPTPRSPRVFWVGVEADEHLAQLARRLQQAQRERVRAHDKQCARAVRERLHSRNVLQAAEEIRRIAHRR